jgi:hypothetical protein
MPLHGLAHTPFTQSAAPLQALPSLHLGHWAPPQSTSVSVPFLVASLHPAEPPPVPADPPVPPPAPPDPPIGSHVPLETSKPVEQTKSQSVSLHCEKPLSGGSGHGVQSSGLQPIAGFGVTQSPPQRF